jgi:hypothetical protein
LGGNRGVLLLEFTEAAWNPVLDISPFRLGRLLSGPPGPVFGLGLDPAFQSPFDARFHQIGAPGCVGRRLPLGIISGLLA